MNKFLSFLFLLLPVCAGAASWGALADYDGPSAGERQTFRPGGNYLLGRVLGGHPVRVWLEAEPEKRNKYQNLIAENYDRWFSVPAQMIRRAGREEEFSDVLPVLERGVRVQFVESEKERDIIIYFHPLKDVTYFCRGAFGCYFPQNKESGESPVIFLPQDQWWRQLVSGGKVSAKSIGQHETGHSLGLSDQYERARSANSHAVYSTQQTTQSLMNSAKDISCDDADGIINLIDITLSSSSRRAREGWRSLCKRSDAYYKAGKPVSKGAYAITSADKKGGVWTLQTYKNGQKYTRDINLNLRGGFGVLRPTEETVLERDGLNRPTLARGAAGEEIYYSYTYDKTIRLAVRGNSASSVEVSYPFYFKNNVKNKKNAKVIFFGENNGVSSLGYFRPAKKRGKEGTAFYDSAVGGEVALAFDAAGNIIQESGPDSDSNRIQSARGLSSANNQAEGMDAERMMRAALAQAASPDRVAEKQKGRLTAWYLSLP